MRSKPQIVRINNMYVGQHDINGQFSLNGVCWAMVKSLTFLMFTSAVLVSGCSPKVQIIAPDKPIEINLNVKIDQEVRVRLEKDVQDLIENNPDLF